MIEALIKYIEDKGYTVGVIPETLLIRKIAYGQQVGIDWAISQIELASLPWELLTDEADRRIGLIEDAIRIKGEQAQ